MATDSSHIEIRSLYKVFGDDPDSVMPYVREGMDKQELLETHGHVLALRDIDLAVETGSIQVVMGLSGCGKSTLVRHVNRLIEPTEGSVEVDGQDVRTLDRTALQDLRRHKVSMVFQHFALFPHRTVLENVRYGLQMQGVARPECDERAQRWIDRVALTGYEGSYPHELSGGMQQRVGLARALATEAEILLMDEAFSALDPLIRADMQTLLLELQRELHRTILFVTHDLDEAITIGDRIAILRDGVVVQNGDSQEIVLQPSDDYISNFTRNINRGRVIQVGSIMEPAEDGAPAAEPDPDACVPSDMVLEEALSLVVDSSGEEAPVVDLEGRTVGAISVERMVHALAGDTANGEDEEAGADDGSAAAEEDEARAAQEGTAKGEPSKD
ncbi:MAG: glycine betaine/L-proline ABC transporter ATP-binding protein [Deltaproteobacteria bacterium]|nr:glycine betaine/L-proline ABC transporter ATP-binding protein [Deltaproteobacteria bacterium]